MWKLFCIAGTPEFHTPPTAQSLPAALPGKAHKMVSGPGQAFAWYLRGWAEREENLALPHPLGRAHVQDTLREKGLSHFGVAVNCSRVKSKKTLSKTHPWLCITNTPVRAHRMSVCWSRALSYHSMFIKITHAASSSAAPCARTGP